MDLKAHVEKVESVQVDEQLRKAVVLTALCTPQEFKALVQAEADDGSLKLSVKG